MGTDAPHLLPEKGPGRLQVTDREEAGSPGTATRLTPGPNFLPMPSTAPSGQRDGSKPTLPRAQSFLSGPAGHTSQEVGRRAARLGSSCRPGSPCCRARRPRGAGGTGPRGPCSVHPRTPRPSYWTTREGWGSLAGDPLQPPSRLLTPRGWGSHCRVGTETGSGRGSPGQRRPPGSSWWEQSRQAARRAQPLAPPRGRRRLGPPRIA